MIFVSYATKLLKLCPIFSLIAITPWKLGFLFLISLVFPLLFNLGGRKFLGPLVNSVAKTIVRKLAWGLWFAYLWQERNSRSFKGIHKAPSSLVDQIKFQVRGESPSN